MEKPIGTSTLFFGAIIVLLTYASIAPQFQAGVACQPLYKCRSTQEQCDGLACMCLCMQNRMSYA